MKLIPKYKDGNKYEPRKNSEGKYIINPKDPRDVKFLHELQGKRGAKAGNSKDLVKGLYNAAAFATPLGDAEDAINIYQDVKKGNYGSALLTAGLLLPSLIIPGNLNKGKKLINKSTSSTSSTVDPYLIQKYKQRKAELNDNSVFDNPDIDIIEDNVNREIAWLPANEKIQLSDNTFTTLQSAVRHIDDDMYSRAVDTYLDNLDWSGDVDKLKAVKETLNRIKAAKQIVKNPNVRTFQGFYAIPENLAEADKYDFLNTNTDGITFHDKKESKAFVRKPVEMIQTRSTTPLHENEHVYQRLMRQLNGKTTYTPAQENLFNKVYGVLDTARDSSTSIREKGATNKELQRLMKDLFKKQRGYTPTWHDTNRFIDNLPDEQLLEFYERPNQLVKNDLDFDDVPYSQPINDYHRDYLDFYFQQRKYANDDFIRSLRNVLKYGPALAAPLAISSTVNNEEK